MGKNDKRYIFITGLSLIAAISALCNVALAQQEGGRKIVDFQADRMSSLKVADSSALCLAGNVIFYHNQAIITCDSAVRYNDRRMECFKNVVINKGTLYAYGDRADYNGQINTARIYAPIIKIVDKDATMYCYDFSFNTKTSIGYYGTTATLFQKDNRFESVRGYYNTKTREMTGVERVQMRNPDYKIISDSVTYNLNTEVTRFHTRSYIWDKNDRILSSNRGWRDNKNSQYFFTSDAYILSKGDEIWADSIDYLSTTEKAILQGNVQIRDDEQQTLAFGDRGLYWGDRQHAILTKRPSLISFDPKEDSLFMRSDSMVLITMDKDFAAKQDSLLNAATLAGEEEIVEKPKAATDSTAITAGHDHNVKKEAQKDKLSFWEWLKNLFSGKKKKAGASGDEASNAADTTRTVGVKGGDGIIPADTSGVIVPLDSLVKGKLPADSLTSKVADKSPPVAGAAVQKGVGTDTLQAAKSPPPALRPEDIKPKSLNKDSVVRVIKAYNNVKIFRNDFQSVCDSLISFSVDSTIHLYKDPVLWNGANQIKSQVMDIFTENQKLKRGMFTGEPIMSSETVPGDTTHYNQVKGKTMESFFRDSQIYRTDVNGNGQTYYYFTDDATGALQGFLVIECANITFHMKDKQIEMIVYRGDPVYNIYPMKLIPEDQPLKLPGFVWEGDRRPALKDVFDRTIRPSRREEYTNKPKPAFPISEQIDRNRENLIRTGVWHDRNDVISPDTYDFINSLGY